ncbi:hypothetical protein REPUB_Repub13aG0211600 [Reevesia pubescens]
MVESVSRTFSDGGEGFGGEIRRILGFFKGFIETNQVCPLPLSSLHKAREANYDLSINGGKSTDRWHITGWCRLFLLPELLEMANSRLPRFIMEVAPPQFVTVMRHGTRKVLDTISEEDRDGSNNDSLSHTSKSSPTAIPVGAMAAASSSSATAVTANSSKYFLKGLSSFSIFNK